MADRLGGLPGQLDGVVDPRQRRRHRKRLVDHLATRAREREQVTGEVAAVDGRHVFGFERVEVARVVPVVQVPAIPLETVDRGERRLEALDHLDRADPAEVARGHRREQVQADVGRRRAVRDHGGGVVLEVVGGQPVVVGPDERLEEPPRQASGAAQRVLVRRREPIRDRLGRGEADPPGDDRRQQPQGDERQGDPARAGIGGDDEHGAGCREHNAACHLAVEPIETQAVGRLCLRGGHPLEELPSGPIQPRDGADDRIAHQPRLVRQEREPEADVDRRQGDVRADGPQMAALGDAGAPGEQSRGDRHGGGDDDRCQHEQGPRPGSHRRERPGGDQRGQRQRGGQRAAEVVDHLPAGDPGNGAAVPPAGAVTGPSEDPGQQLPVAARPAMLPRRRDQVVRRELVEQLHIRDEPGPREHALEQVVAEERVLGDPVRHCRPERVEVVDPLARVAPLTEQILVDVRDRRGVRVDPGRARIAALVDRRVALDGKGRRDPRLEHPVAFASRARRPSRMSAG